MKESALKMAQTLIVNGFRYRYQKNTGKPGRVQALSLEITHDCIARCVMCNIWKIPGEVPNLPADDWVHLLSSGLFSDLRELDVTGGEPFLKKDLVDMFQGICALKDKNLKSLRSIAVTTNGFLTRRVLEYTEEILARLQEKHIDLVIVCAMDAIGDIHEKIRNYKDAWSKVNATIEGMKKIRDQYPNLIVGLKTTILPINVGELDKIVEYADSNGLFTIISPCIITDGRYLNRELSNELAFRPEHIEEMIKFYKSRRFKWSFHGDSLVGYLQTGTIRKPCTCGFNYFFVRSNGDAYLCPLINKKIGNIRDTPVEELFASGRAARIRRRIGRFPECAHCTEPGLERYALPYEGFTYLSMLGRMGRKDFFELHRHMGLDKYLD